MANKWMQGNGTDALQGDDNASNIDDNVTAYLQDPLDRLLSNYRQDCLVSYASSSTVTISSGEVVCSNSADDARRMRKNTSSVTLSTASDMDTGSVTNDQTYYVYAVADADATTFTGIISLSNTFPTDVTYARRLGSFETDGSSDITSTSVSDDADNHSKSFGDWDNTSYSEDTVYQASTDGFVIFWNSAAHGMKGYTDGSNPPTTQRIYQNDSNDIPSSFTMPVKAGDYWKVTAGSGTMHINWIPLS